MKIGRRKFLQYTVLAGAVGVSTWLGYRQWPDQSSLTPASSETAPPVPIAGTASILLLTNNAVSPFGSYLGEILRAEGLNLFQTLEIQALTPELLNSAALVVLTEGPVTIEQIPWLETYVAEGGCLIAMRPDASLSSLFGVKAETGVTTNGYLKIESSQPSDTDLTTETLQFHGQANHYRPMDATVLARLYHDRATPTDWPAVTVRSHGQGWAALWAFDLARSVAYTRQGDPLKVGQERDGFEGFRAQELFFDWIDLERMGIPQVDEQMRLLSQLITKMIGNQLPLPRLWHLPNASPALLVVTGDSHANPVTNIEAVLTLVEAYNGTMSILYTPQPRSDNPLRRMAALTVQQVQNWLNPFPVNQEQPPTPAQVEQWRARGHEFSLHPYVEAGLAEGYQAYVAAFEAEGYTFPAVKTVRTHRVLWSGWVETAKVQAANGFGMNLDFYQMGSLLRTKDGRWMHGYFTGSGRPMKMVDEIGQVVDNYQLLTELIDEQLLKGVNSGYEGLDPAAAIAVSQQMIDNALTYHTVLATQFHVDFYHPTSPVRNQVETWAKGTLAYAAEKGLPIWNAARFLEFVRCKDQAQIQSVTWDEAAQQLTFWLYAAPGGDFELTLLVPAANDIRLIEVDGRPVNFILQNEAGLPYAWFSVPPHQHTINVWYGKV